MSIVNNYLSDNKKIRVTGHGYEFRELAPRIVCADGFSLSVQVSDGHYCTPRRNDSSFYTEVEVGYPSEYDPDLHPYAEDPATHSTVYGYVPVGIVDDVITRHGGIAQSEGG